MFTFNIVILLVWGVFGGDADDEKSVFVMEGDSVTLHTDLSHSDVIRWRFGEKDSLRHLVEIDKNMIFYADDVDERLRDRLQMNNQTGDLTIKNMRIKHSGRYEAEIFKARTEIKAFRVTVYEPPGVLDVDACDVEPVPLMSVSVTLPTDVQTQRGDLIVWRFGDDGVLIAKDDKEDNKSSIYEDVFDGRFRDRLKLDHKTGDLTITDFRTTDSGLYKLKISSNGRRTLYKTFNHYVGGFTTHPTHFSPAAEKSFSAARSLTVPITKGTPFSVAVVVTYVVLLFLSLLVLLAIAVYQSHRKTSGLRQIIASCISAGDKGGICVAVFHCVVTVLLLLLVVLTGVVTFSYINNLDLKQMDDNSSTSLAVLFGVLQTLLFLAVMKVFQTISHEKQRELGLGVLCLLLLLVLIVVIYTFGFVDLKHVEGHMAKVYIVLLVLMVLGVIYHFSESFYLMMIKVNQMPVFEGESVFLPTGVTELQSDDVIQLSFRDEVIAKFNKDNMISCEEEKFRDRLQMHKQTGSLTIRDMRTEDAGLYKVKISSRSRVKSFLQFIISGGQSYSQFSVNVYDSAVIRENESRMVESLLNEKI